MEVGLPSNVGIFLKQKSAEVREKSTNKYSSFLNMISVSSSSRKEHAEVKISEINDSSITSLCSISSHFVEPKLHSDDIWMGPKIRMSLPNFSGRTIHNPLLLKYSCQMECRMRAVAAAKVSGACIKYEDNESDIDRLNSSKLPENNAFNQCISILLSKPVLALEFNFLKMEVNAPTVVVASHNKNNISQDSTPCLGDCVGPDHPVQPRPTPAPPGPALVYSRKGRDGRTRPMQETAKVGPLGPPI